jgi:1-acyl-sn-glycerol-3-phosphate acyltransferase
VLFAANHLSLFDGPLALMEVPGRMTMTVATYVWKMPVVNLLFKGVGAVPLQGTREDLKSFRVMKARLQRGGRVFIFPEGHVSKDGSIDEFRRGAALLQKQTGAVVVPIGIAGTETIVPWGKIVPEKVRVPVAMIVGEPLEISPEAEVGEITDMMRAAVVPLAEKARGLLTDKAGAKLAETAR